MLSILLGCGFVIIASVGASVGLIFQKKAHANPPVLMNLEWWTGIIIATLASITDSVALIFIRTSTIAVLACISIPINVIVSGRLLKETTTTKQRMYLTAATVGILVAILAVPHNTPSPNDLEFFTRSQTITALLIVSCAWIATLTIEQLLPDRNPFFYAIMAGISGAQFLTYGTAAIHTGHIIINVTQTISIAIMALLSLLAHVYTLNVALASGDAIPVTTTFQCTWCVANILHGIFIFNDLKNGDPIRISIFALGVLFTLLATVGAQYHRSTK